MRMRSINLKKEQKEGNFIIIGFEKFKIMNSYKTFLLSFFQIHIIDVYAIYINVCMVCTYIQLLNEKFFC